MVVFIYNNQIDQFLYKFYYKIELNLVEFVQKLVTLVKISDQNCDFKLEFSKYDKLLIRTLKNEDENYLFVFDMLKINNGEKCLL